MRKIRLSAIVLAAAVALSSTGCSDAGMLTQSAKELGSQLQAELSSKKSDSASENETAGKSGEEADSAAVTESDEKDEAGSDTKNKNGAAAKEGKTGEPLSSDNRIDKDSELSDKDSDKDTDNKAKVDRKRPAKNDDSDLKRKTESKSQADADSSEASGKNEKASVLDSLPEIGDRIHGFTVTDINDYEPKNAKVVSMTHEKSGAELLYIACDDTDKAFAVYFRTAAESDQGIPHIFEHVTLAGSGKYPNSNLFNDLLLGSYNTYMNASTWQELTGYMMSSLSDKQLLKLADFYMSGLTDPIALRDENTLGREAYRFEMPSLSDDITVTGAVFNEMEGYNAGLEMFSYNNTLKLLYPSSRMSFNSGGFRNDIITVDINQLKAFYSKYYHPSNMLITMYGDMDYEEYLEMLDEDYLSAYDKKTVTISDSKYIPWTGEKKAVIDYPVTEDADADNSGIVDYAVSLGSLSAYDAELMSIVTSMIGLDGSPLKKKVEEEFPDADFSVYMISDLDEPMVMFELNGSSEGDAETFKKAVNEGIAEMTDNGLDKELLEAALDMVKMQNALSQEQPGGISTINSFGSAWAVYGDKLSQLEMNRALDELESAISQGKLDELLYDYLSEPQQAVLAEYNPKPGLREAEDEAFAELLADKKTSLTKSEQAQLVGSTAAFEAWSESQADTSRYMEELGVLDKDDLEEYVQESDGVQEETLDKGIRELKVPIKDAIYLNSYIYLKADTLDYNEIHDMVFLGELIGKLGTGNYTSEELSNELIKKIYSFNAGLNVVYDEASGKPQPYFDIHALCIDDNINDTFDLLKELLTGTDFTDTKRIRSIASTAALNYKSGTGYQLALNAAAAAADDNRKYAYHASDTDYLSYLNKVSKMNDRQLKELGEELRTVLDKLLNTNGAVYAAYGSEDAIAEGEKHISSLAADCFSTEKLATVDYSKELAKIELPKSIAVAINDTVNYNGCLASLEALGAEDNGANNVSLNVIYNKLLYPAFRYDIGAYGLLEDITDDSIMLMSYRDPSVSRAFDAYASIYEDAQQLEITDDDIENALLYTYSSYAQPLSASGLAENEITRMLQNKSESYAEETLAKMRSAKSTTAEDVMNFAEIMQSMSEKGVRFTAGSTDSIKKNKELYELTIDALVK